MRLSICYYPHDAPSEALAIAQSAEDHGFDGFYYTDSPLRHDPWALLGATAVNTTRIRIGPSAIRMAGTDPLTAARALATVDTMSGGRVDAVLGVGTFFLTDSQAEGFSPSAFMRESFGAVRTALAEARPRHQGRYFQYAIKGIAMRARPVQERIPLIFGSSGGPKLIELAGEIADGVHLAPAATRSAYDHLVSHAQVGAERGGRDWRELDIAIAPIIACAEDGDLAREVARVHTCFYIPFVPRALFEALAPSGRSWEDFEEIGAAYGDDIAKAVSLVTRADADLLSIAGTPAECRERLGALVSDTGVEHLAFMFADAAHVEMLLGEAPERIPTVREQLHLFHSEVLTALGWT
jgi:5,10-methylenetetrahydromethanopterin reductase